MMQLKQIFATLTIGDKSCFIRAKSKYSRTDHALLTPLMQSADQILTH
jgi:hypothetical protein